MGGFRGLLKIKNRMKRVSLIFAVAALLFAANFTSCTDDDINVSGITINGDKEVNMTVGARVTLAVTIEPANATIKDIRWTSSAPDIVSVDVEKGSIEALKEGKCTVTASAGGRSVDFAVTVHPFEGLGTADKPYQIATAAHLVKLADLVFADAVEPWVYSDKFYLQTANIALGVAPYNSGEGWGTIGASYARSFRGTYDGAGYSVTGLKINRIRDNQALFGNVVGGTIRNLAVTDVDVTGGAIPAGLVGNIFDGSIANCYVTGSVSGSNVVGGIAGYIHRSKIENCYSTASVFGSGTSVGGVVGSVIQSSVKFCYATNNVFGVNHIGGIAGETGAPSGTSSESITNCVAIIPTIWRTGTGTGTDFGRIAGGHKSTCTMNDNFAYVATINPGLQFTGTSRTGKDGETISFTQWGSSAWWSGTAGFNAANWDMAANRLPRLKTTDGKTFNQPQNPSVLIIN
jgi:hypothetical protein